MIRTFYVWQIPGQFMFPTTTPGSYHGDRAIPSMTLDALAEWIQGRIVMQDYPVEIYDLNLVGASMQGSIRRGPVVVGQYRYMVMQELGDILGFIQIGHGGEIEFVSSRNFGFWHRQEQMDPEHPDFPVRDVIDVPLYDADDEASMAEYMALWAQTHSHG